MPQSPPFWLCYTWATSHARQLEVSVPKSWHKRRYYAHFDLPVTSAFLSSLKTPRQITRHAFLPFLGYSLVEKRFKRDVSGNRSPTYKRRHIAYASHRDSAIFDYYNHILSALYEDVLAAEGIGNNVIAYRRFGIPRSNIHFAKEVFDFIRETGPSVAVGIDIEDFFGTIPHSLVKTQWTRLLGSGTLPEDHYKVYRALTRWTFIDRERLLLRLGKSKYALDSWPRFDRLCSPTDFRAIAVPLIEPGYKLLPDGAPRGIPQGSPLSGLVSNFALLDLDIRLEGISKKHNALYRRYSDDLILVGNQVAVNQMQAAIEDLLRQYGMTVNASKVSTTKFVNVSNSRSLSADTALQYLGFTFDGQIVLLRSQTLSRSYRRMKASVRSAKRAAEAAAKRGGQRRLRREKIFERHSHLGAKKRGGARKSNFYTYAKRATAVHDSPSIRRQVKRQWPKLLEELKKADEG